MISLYPHNLLLVSLAAGISMYLGFLPVKDTPRHFFIQQAFVTIVLWALAAFISGRSTGLYILGCGLMATTAWRQFCFQREFLAKLWMSGATAFGGILCLLSLIIIPPAPTSAGVWFITSIYFGALVLTTTYIPAALAVTQNRGDAVPVEFVKNALAFSFLAIGLRAALLIATLVAFPHMFPQAGWGQSVVDYLTKSHLQPFIGWIGLGMVFPTAIGIWAYFKIKGGMKVEYLWRPLALSFLSALAGEYIIRNFYF
jgi:hypothetical protein